MAFYCNSGTLARAVDLVHKHGGWPLAMISTPNYNLCKRNMAALMLALFVSTYYSS